MGTRTISVSVNGQAHHREVEHRLTLADFLRGELRLTGTHVGCEHGVCGACTVLVDGHSTRSCLMLAVQVDGKSVTTVEHLSSDGRLDPLQEALWNRHGLQCGFCTPGILMSLTEYLGSTDEPTRSGIIDVLSGHLCRCTGYQNIIAAAEDAAGIRRTEGAAGD